jgi:putative membrane protein
MLLLYSGIATFFLSVVSRGTNSLVPFLLAFLVFALSVSAVSSALLLTDKKTIATFRRINAVLLAGLALWLLCAAGGVVYVLLRGSPSAVTNAIVFGAFATCGLEFLVINGAFTGQAPFALGLAAIHPVSTLVILRFTELSHSVDPAAILFGGLAFGIMAAFPFLLKRRKTSLGYDALTLFQAFMKTWANGDAAKLEGIISAHSEDAEITTKVLRFQTEAGNTFIILPGVHPGPFHPVGSYDLPGVVSRAFKDLGPVMTLHRPGGHERNLATAAETAKYAGDTSAFARGVETSGEPAQVKGPIHATIGKANVTSTAFSRDLLLTVSFAPLGSDDLSPKVEKELSGPASASGFEASVVDAHNSIDDGQQSPDVTAPGWGELFAKTKLTKAEPFRVGYSHSKEIGFGAHSDLTENGIGLLMLETSLGKSVLVLADANNAVPNLRAQTLKELESSGYGLLELCTSDSHNLAARGLTVSRGYKALGEATPVPSISKLVVEMAKLADKRLAPSRYGSGQLTSTLRVFGSKSLEEFAGVTQESSRLGRAYFRFAVVSTAVLLLLSIVL